MIDASTLRAMAGLCAEAGRAILAVYEGEAIAVRTKDDRSPVTEADEAAEAILVTGLLLLFPGVSVVAEEACALDGVPENVAPRFLLVDPLDGTREFISRNGEFTVNVGLIEDGRPVAGCVHAPALGATWIGAEGLGAFVARTAPGEAPGETSWRPIAARRPEAALCAVTSRSHSDQKTEAFLGTLSVKDRRSAGSSLKFCLVAEGEADVYPRFGPTMEWDTAAGHAVLAAAGGSVVQPDGSAFLYGKTEQALRNGGFVAWGRRAG